MIARIALVLDKSAGSRQALEIATRIAAQQEAELAGLVLLSGYAMSRAELWRAQRDLEGARDRFRLSAAHAGVASTIKELEELPVDAVLEEATSCDVLVMGKDAACWDAAERPVSAVVQGLLSRSARPVLLTGVERADLQRVLVAFDGSDAASRTMHLFALLGLCRGARVDVVSIDDDGAQATKLAEAAAELLRLHGAASVTPVPIASRSDPAHIILDRARSAGAGILVMGAYGNGGLRELFFGSCTRRVLESCEGAVFVHR